MEPVTQTFEQAVQEAANFGALLLLIGAALIVVPYVLFGIGLHSVASRYRLRNSWMAWVPIARKHLLAEVADLRRYQARKQKKLTTQFEIISCLLLACIYAATKIASPLFVFIPLILIILLAYNQAFCYYYFYRLCDLENSTIYFILGLVASPLNSIFVYQCR